MKKFLYLSISLLCVIIAGCGKDSISGPDLTPVPGHQTQEFIATLATPVTKTTITGAGEVSWVSSDAIGVFDSGKEAPIKATIKSISDDGKTAVFTPASEISNPVGAIYPYDANATLSYDVVSLPLKASQSGAFAEANIAASKADEYKLSFQNVTSIFKFKITDENVKSAKLTGTGVGGTLDITLGNLISSSLSETSTVDMITVSNITPGTDYYVTIAPKTYDDLQFSWYDSTGAELGTSTLDKSTAVSAGMLYAWGDLTERQDVEGFVQFEDANFKAYCVENFDSDGDGEISKEEAMNVKEINVYTNDITSLVGIERFTKLEKLTCVLNTSFSYSTAEGGQVYFDDQGNEIELKLKSLDVSRNTAMTSLICSNNQLSSLDVCNNLKLTFLNCGGNQLTALDLSKNTELTFLDCVANQLTTLDLSKNTELTDLCCSSNQLTTLDLSKNTELTDLRCSSNQLTTLDLSKNTELAYLNCSDNPFSSLDVSKNTALTFLDCEANHLTAMDLSKNTELEYLDCRGNQLMTLDVSKNTKLISLNCSINQLATLDVSKNTALTSLYCYINELTTLDVSKNTALIFFGCYYNQIPYIYIWNGFKESEHPSWRKDDSSIYVEVGDSPSDLKDYIVEST